jgi:hypothetical protein
MSEVAVTWICGSIVTVSEVAGWHDAKSPDGRQRATLRSPQCAFAVARVVDDLAVSSARQVEAAREHLARVAVAIARVAITVSPSHMITIPRVAMVVNPVAPIVVVFLDAM